MDKTTKVLLVFIGMGLWLNALLPVLRPAHMVKASSSYSCSGKLKASAFGATEAMVGGYDVDVTCSE